MLANMLLFAVVGGLLEHRYGTIRISIVLVLSTLGAAFFSGAFEDRCTQARKLAPSHTQGHMKWSSVPFGTCSSNSSTLL